MLIKTISLKYFTAIQCNVSQLILKARNSKRNLERAGSSQNVVPNHIFRYSWTCHGCRFVFSYRYDLKRMLQSLRFYDFHKKGYLYSHWKMWKTDSNSEASKINPKKTEQFSHIYCLVDNKYG